MELARNRWRSAVAGALVILGVSAASAQPVRPPGSSASAEFYLKRGEDFSGAREYNRAIADYTRAIELRPGYSKAYNSRGVVYMAHGYGQDTTVADFDRAIALKPDFRYAYINRANARLIRHPWLALNDFHRAGMHPERSIAMLGGTILIVVAGIAMIRRRRR
jgi:tetratricopeptide (TPR) repeat protein